MPNIIGEPLRPYVKSQINTRQKAHGSGVYGNRTPDQLAYLNSKTAWVKLASGVEIDNRNPSPDNETAYDRASKEGIRPGLAWNQLAKKYVLFSGISRLEGKKLIPKGNASQKNNIYDWFDGTYNITAQEEAQYSGEMGLVPMPGIIDASIKCENRGSIKKATVNIKCYSPEQFKILDLLYLRIGYTMFLEWGWAPYLKDDGTLEHDYSTLIEANGGFFNEKWKTTTYKEFLQNIEIYRKEKSGNYDGLLCRVVNFSWTFSQDGTYDIQLNLISLGDVIESLKANLTPTAELTEVILNAYKLYGDEEIDEEELKENPPAPVSNIISAYFFLQRIYLTKGDEEYWDKYECPNTFGNDIKNLPIPTVFIRPSKDIIKSLTNINQNEHDFIYFSYANLNDDETTVNDEGVYVRFGHFLEFLQDNAIFKTQKSNTRIIDIDFDEDSNKMYVFPYQVSLDPRVCLVKNSNEEEAIKSKKWLNSPNIPEWKIKDDGEPYGKIMNIYLNCNMINRIVLEKQDEKGNVSLFELLESICPEINRSLGDLNNLDVSIDEDTNTIKILDASYVPTIKPDPDPLELYGYSKDQTESNFVYDFNIKTEITNDFATMASVGSTAGGYVKGTENTMFSKWNKGLIDRFKDKYIPPSKNISDGKEEEKEPSQIYVEEFWNKRYSPFGVTAPQEDTFAVNGSEVEQEACSLDAEVIDKNISIVTEFYKYCQYRIQLEKEKYASPTTGFIPISLGLTLEGISGIKIYNFLEVSTRMLPSNYPDALKFIIKGVDHKIVDGRWETGIETVVIANNFEKDGTQVASYSFIKSVVDKVRKEGEAIARQAKIAENQANAPRPRQSQEEVIYEGDTVDQPIDVQVISETGSDLEKYMKEAAQEFFKANGETKGGCGGATYRLAERLAKKLTKKASFPGTGVGGNNAYSEVLRKHLNELGIYSQESLSPVGTGLSNEQYRTKISEITKQANYGDVLVYFATPPPKLSASKNAKFHAQIYTGNLYTNSSNSLGVAGKGWTTDNKPNYGTESVYRDAKGHPWTIYWFRIKDEYKTITMKTATEQVSGTNSSSKEDKEKSANAFNSLTYRIALIWTLKDNYSNGKPLFEKYKGINDDEDLAIKAAKAWFNKSEQQKLYQKMTYNDQDQFKKYLFELYTRTRSGGDPVTFKSYYNNDVNKRTINPDF